MKKTTIILTIAASALLAGCKPSQLALEQRRYEVSWEAFCSACGYDIDDSTIPVYSEYLDTWCGSVDEENAFINAGVEPY